MNRFESFAFFVGVALVMGASAMTAYAATSAVSFGANFYYRYPCTCTAGEVWYLIIPKYGNLSYAIGSQGRSSWNLPFSKQILGLYEPGTGAACWVGVEPYCTLIPTLGEILPMVGSDKL